MKNKVARNTKKRKVTDLRQDNAMPAPAHVGFCESRPAIIDFSTHKVGKSGSVHLGDLPKGVNVNVARVDDIFLVSARPKNELKQIASQIPISKPSSLSALSAEIRGVKHSDDTGRTRHPYTGIVEVGSPSDEEILALSNLRRVRRVR